MKSQSTAWTCQIFVNNNLFQNDQFAQNKVRTTASRHLFNWSDNRTKLIQDNQSKYMKKLSNPTPTIQQEDSTNPTPSHKRKKMINRFNIKITNQTQHITHNQHQYQVYPRLSLVDTLFKFNLKKIILPLEGINRFHLDG